MIHLLVDWVHFRNALLFSPGLAKNSPLCISLGSGEIVLSSVLSASYSASYSSVLLNSG